MKKRLVVGAIASILACGGIARAAELKPPKAGKVEIFPLKDVKPGMQGTAWTVFSGTEPEPVPIEIIGVWKGQRDRAARDSRQDGRARQRDQRRGGDERQSGLYRRETGGRGGAALQRVLARCDLRHHAHRVDARDSRFRQVASRGRAHARQELRPVAPPLSRSPANCWDAGCRRRAGSFPRASRP